MACTIVSNNIPVLETREAVSAAVLAGIGDKTGNWKVIVYQAPDYAGLAIRIEGPNVLRLSWTFFGEEQTPEFVRERIAQGVVGSFSLESGFK